MSILQPAVKKETQKVVVYTVVGVVLMWGVLFLLRPTMPDKIVFDYTTILAGIIGGGVAILNFFLMGISVQNIAATEDQDLAKKKMKTSYSQRLGGDRHCGSLFLFRGGNFTAVIPESRDQIYGSY